jgi:hypothetical protein
MTEEGIEELIQCTTQATIASMQVDDMSAITTVIDNSSTVTNTNNNKRPKSAIPDGSLKQVKPSIHKVHTSNVQRTNQTERANISLLSACGQENNSNTI